jgi:hypothetical protein
MGSPSALGFDPNQQVPHGHGEIRSAARASVRYEAGHACDEGKWLPGPLAKKVLIDSIAGWSVACHQVD